MGDAFDRLLPFLAGLPGFTLAAVYFRAWIIAQRQRAQAERRLDAERERRRRIEDKVDLLSREVRALTAEVARLRTLLGEPT